MSLHHPQKTTVLVYLLLPGTVTVIISVTTCPCACCVTLPPPAPEAAPPTSSKTHVLVDGTVIWTVMTFSTVGCGEGGEVRAARIIVGMNKVDVVVWVVV